MRRASSPCLLVLALALAAAAATTTATCAPDDAATDDDGDGHDEPTTGTTTGATGTSAAPRSGAATEPSSTRESTTVDRLTRSHRHELRQLHDHARPGSRPTRPRRSSRSRRDGYFDGTVFHRIVAGLRDPGRRPDRHRRRRPRLLDRRHAVRGRPYTHGVVAMAKTPDEPPRHRRAASSSSSPRPTSAAAGLRDHRGTVTEGIETVVDAIDDARRRRRAARRRS